MKTRDLKAVVVGLLAAGLLISATPARAASLSWEDPKGDAADQGNLQNPAFDMTSVQLSNNGGTVKLAITVPGMVTGRPTAATGYTFRLKFKYAESDFRLQINENLLGQTSANLGLVGANTTTVYPCEKCEAKIDREKKIASMTAPIASLEAGFKAAGKPALAGKEWTDLIAQGMRQTALPVPPGSTPSDGLRSEADAAPAPEGTTLAF